MSEGKSKGVISLRKKKTVTARPKISAPQQIVSNPSSDSIPSLHAPVWTPSQNLSPSQNTSQTSLPIPRPRPSISGGTDKTADLVKRRYSTRFAQPQDNELPPPIPGLPQFPAQYASKPPSSRSGRSPDRRREGQHIPINVKALTDPHLKPDQCPLLP